ncbi:hypothetical protein D3C77_385880 [compost metagenome]
MPQVLGSETTQGEAFFAYVLAGKPGIGNHFQLFEWSFPRLVDFQGQAIAPATTPGVAQVLHLFALGVQIKAIQIDASLLPQLDGSQADVHIERQVLGAHLVEDWAGMVHITQVAKLPDHLGTLVRRADGVIQGYQATTTLSIHKERIIIGMEQQCFVAGQRQSPIRLVRRLQYTVGSLQLFLIRQMNHRACGAKQPGERERH